MWPRLWVSHMFDLLLFWDRKSARTFNSEAGHYEWILCLLPSALWFFILSVCFDVVWTPSPQAALCLPEGNIRAQEVQRWRANELHVARRLSSRDMKCFMSSNGVLFFRYVNVYMALWSRLWAMLYFQNNRLKYIDLQKCVSLPNWTHIVSCAETFEAWLWLKNETTVTGSSLMTRPVLQNDTIVVSLYTF